MKVLFPSIKFFPTQSGGPIYTLLWHCTALRKENLDVYIITTDTGFDSIKESLPHKNKYINSKFGKIIYYSGKFKLLKMMRELKNQLSDSDVLHLNSFFSPVSFISFIVSTIFFPKVKIVWSVRGEFNQSALKFSSIKKRPILFLLKPLTKKVIFHATSDLEISDIERVVGKRSTLLIPNLMKFHPRLDEIRENYFLFMGRIHPIKCIENFIEALSLSKLFRQSNYMFVIAGKYEQRYKWYFEKLTAMIESYNLERQVEFRAHITGLNKWETYARAKFLILPSRTENFGNVILEALSQGTPAIASLGTPWSELNIKQAGFHTSNEVSNLSNLVDQIILMTDNDYKKYVENAYELAHSKYNITFGIKEWVKSYAS